MPNENKPDFYIDCHRMTVPENILLQKSTDNNDMLAASI